MVKVAWAARAVMVNKDMVPMDNKVVLADLRVVMVKPREAMVNMVKPDTAKVNKVALEVNTKDNKVMVKANKVALVVNTKDNKVMVKANKVALDKVNKVMVNTKDNKVTAKVNKVMDNKVNKVDTANNRAASVDKLVKEVTVLVNPLTLVACS